MEVWESIRLRCRRDGEKIKPVARDLGLAPNTVRKYLRQDTPPQAKTPPRPKLLDRFQSHVDELIRSTPRITATRIGSYLRQNVDADLRIGERALRVYVADRRKVLVPKEAFIRAAYAPGDQSQFDFSPMSVYLAGVLVVVQLFVVRLSYSGRFMARTSMHCDQPALFAGLLAGFSAFGGLTRTALFDNASTAVKRVLRGRNRTENEAFAAFRGGLALHVTFAAPAKGNEKGGVEGVHGYIEDNFFRPIPSFTDLDELNASLARFCDASLDREHSTYHEAIGKRFAREQPAPPGTASSSPARVRYTICAHQQIRGGLLRVQLVLGSDAVRPSSRRYRDLRNSYTGHRCRRGDSRASTELWCQRAFLGSEPLCRLTSPQTPSGGERVGPERRPHSKRIAWAFRALPRTRSI